MTATVTVYSGQERFNITGNIVREYANGLTIEDERGVIWYASNDRVTRGEILRAELF